MQLKLNPGDPNFPRLMSTQQAIISSVLSTAAKTDETRLKRKTQDNISELLDLVSQQEKILELTAVPGEQMLEMPPIQTLPRDRTPED